MANRTIRTQEKEEEFLSTLDRVRGNVSDTCELVGVPRRTAYEWRDADESFAQRWDAVVDKHMDALESEVYRRAHDGTRKPVYYKGEQCGEIAEYSDTLAMFILKGHRPEKYRENSRVELGGIGGGPLQLEVNFKEEKVTADEAESDTT
jgi:hypothetical protein